MALNATTPYRSQRKEMFNSAVEAVKELGVDVSKEVVLEAFRDLSASLPATQAQVMQWLSTPEGNEWQFTESLRAVNKQMSDGECRELYCKLTPSQWREFDDFQTEPFLRSMTEQQNLQANLLRSMQALNSNLTSDQCMAVYEYLTNG